VSLQFIFFHSPDGACKESVQGVFVQETKRIALLIDCDNVSHTAIEAVLEELAKYGTVNVRHAHGDWKSPSLSGWAEKLHSHAN
jgi:anti-sigma regulatory factor (Ser/Thr protein kinase)